jgi:hypothetical protein
LDREHFADVVARVAKQQRAARRFQPRGSTRQRARAGCIDQADVFQVEHELVHARGTQFVEFSPERACRARVDVATKRSEGVPAD